MKKSIYLMGVMVLFAMSVLCQSGAPAGDHQYRHDKQFLAAVAVVLAHEGNYSNDPDDRGGETKYGISKKSYPHLDIAKLNLEKAKLIYYNDYWRSEGYDKIKNKAIMIKSFDLAVNMGNKVSNSLIQRALKNSGVPVVVDGVLDIKTIEAINTANSTRLLTALKSEAEKHYRGIVLRNPKQRKFLKGWLKRAHS